jgi:hypothetical protein
VRADTAGAHVTPHPPGLPQLPEAPRSLQVQVLCCPSEEDERDLEPGRRAHGRVIGAGRTRRAEAQKGTGRGVPSLSCPCPLPHSSQQSQCRAMASRIGVAGVPGGNLAGRGSWLFVAVASKPVGSGRCGGRSLSELCPRPHARDRPDHRVGTTPS